MRWRPRLAAFCLFSLAFALIGCARRPPQPVPPPPPTESTISWSLTSTAFSSEGQIPSKYTCDGEDISPPLSWSKPPAGTVELALVCNDPDAPVGNWIHWVLYGLPPDQQSLPEGVPTSETLADLGGAKQGLTDFKKVGYGGPCPPTGPAHHYHFRLYALDAHIDLASRATEAQLTRAMQGHILAQAELVGLYSR